MSLFDDASLVLTPNGYKASKLYSIKPTSGAGDMTVVRATTATRVNSAGLIESVAINVPRLDYPPLGGCPSILVEPERINRFKHSQDISLWFEPDENVTLTSNTTDTISPDGTNNASKITIGSSGIIKRSYQITNSVAGVGTFSGYVKAGTSNQITLFTTLGSINILYNLSTLAITATNGTGTITSVGNGWYRITATNTLIASEVLQVIYTNTAGQTIYIWGFQVEAGSNATSYIPTVAAIVTRNADVISKTGVSSLIGQTEGTLYAEINISTFNYGIFFSINDGTSANRIQMYKFTDNKIYCDRQSATQSATTSISSSALSVGTYKVAFAYESGTSYLYINGAQVGATSAATFTFGSMGKVNIGSRFDDINTFNDRVELAALFPTRLTTHQCIDLTTP
jgi:hypothetical protein